MSNTFHEFSLVALFKTDGKYLQIYDEDWKCWLFPYFRSEDPNKENVDKKMSKLLKCDISTTYVTSAIHCKYSVRDDVYKRYKHKLYKLRLEEIPKYMEQDIFELDGKKCAWKSIEELEKDIETMEKNDDIIAFVKTKCK